MDPPDVAGEFTVVLLGIMQRNRTGSFAGEEVVSPPVSIAGGSFPDAQASSSK
jgi:hypothetical protein